MGYNLPAKSSKSAKLAMCLLGLCLITMNTLVTAQEPIVERQQELLHLLLQDCGSCHGMTLKGGLGPSLTPDVLKDKPESYLIEVILNGRPAMAMPAWQALLNEREVAWLVKLMKAGVPNE